MEPRNRFQGMNSASLCSLAGRYDNPIPTRFLAPMDCFKIPALGNRWWSQDANRPLPLGAAKTGSLHLTGKSERYSQTIWIIRLAAPLRPDVNSPYKRNAELTDLALGCLSKLVSIRNNRNKSFVTVVSLLYRNREFRCFDWTKTNRRATETVW